MTTVLRIIGRNEIYFVDERNQISRPELMTRYSNVGQPAADWTLEGAREYRVVFGRWQSIKSYTIADIRLGKVPWLFKNGSQRCFIVDQDHGATRMWMSPTPYTIWSERITKDSVLTEMLSLHDQSRLTRGETVGIIYPDGAFDLLHPSSAPGGYQSPVPIRPEIPSLNVAGHYLPNLPGRAFGMPCCVYAPKVAAVLRELLGQVYQE